MRLDVPSLVSAARPLRRYTEPSRFPAVKRDLSLVVPTDVASATVAEVIRAAAGELLVRADLFDVYRGDQVPAGMRSLAYALTFQSAHETLADATVDAVIEGVVRKLADTIGVTLREAAP